MISTAPPRLRRLHELREIDASEVGGKAASLGELFASGVHVPDGVVLPVETSALPSATRADLLRQASEELEGGPFAVRSSGVTEDGADRSFAGMYESVLGVPWDGLDAAVDRVLASADAARVAEYGTEGAGGMAVIVQHMVDATAAGVALTADPISGDRDATVITAVRGTGERLVSGEAFGDEWTVRGGTATARRAPEQALDRDQARAVAREARRIAAERGVPQDVEWAIDGGGMVWILQSRPMTALPPQVSWKAPAPGAYTRQLRFGEWISEPVTPLFESWLLTTMEDRLHETLLRLIGQRAPRPHHVVVNGWYFYSLNWFAPSNLARSLPGMLASLLRDPRVLGGAFPPTVRRSIPIVERQWREDIQPRYRTAVADAEARVESAPIDELPSLVDGLADLAGEYFFSIASLGGAAYKMEINLAGFYRRHLAPTLGGSHLPLLAGIEAPVEPDRHAVVSLDWWHEPAPPVASAASPPDHGKVAAARKTAEDAAFAALAGSPKRLRKFRDLLAETQRLVPIREEQTREWTLPWPVMRRAVVRMGEALAARGVLSDADDVFFLTRDELLALLRGEPLGPAVDVARRRAARTEQARLVPPNFVGRVNRAFRAMPGAFARMVGAVPSKQAILTGAPASPGRVTGTVRIVRGPDEFDTLQPGEILVAPLTAPAWTPLFGRAAAVVTDVGSAAAHASIIAREYGIPAVVGCGDATARLRTGMRVTVDGTTGNVEPAQGT